MAMEFLRSRLTILIVASAAAWIFGAAASYYSAAPLPLFFPTDMQATFIAVIVFAFSFLFFGYPAPLIMFLGGMTAGEHARLAGIDTYASVLSIVCLLAAYASIRLGDALLNDMTGKGNFKQAIKISLIIVIVFLAIAAGIDLSG